MQKFDTYVDNPDSLIEGKEIELTVRDLNPGRYKYEMKKVKAVVSRSSDKLPGAAELWLRAPLGEPYPQPWVIKVLKGQEGADGISG